MKLFLYYAISLSPLVYLADNDPYRAYQVVGFAILSLAILLPSLNKSFFRMDVLFVLLYSLILIVQQFAIPNGDWLFGLKFFITTLCAFIPYWAMRSSQSFGRLPVSFFNSIFVILCVGGFLNISLSYFFSIGEVYEGGLLGRRAFGFLGDGFTPILAFLAFYFFTSRNYSLTILSVVSLMMTGGKAAIALLVVMFIVFAFLQFRSLKSKLMILAACLSILWGPEIANIFLSNDEQLAYSLNNRLFSYKIGLGYLLESPVWGIGINQSMTRITNDAILLAEFLGETKFFAVYQIYNPYIRSLAETGIVGFTMLIMLVFFWFRCALIGLRMVRFSKNSKEVSLLRASSIWTISYLVVYQSVSWFEAGHPQLSWLLTFVSITSILTARLQSRSLDMHELHLAGRMHASNSRKYYSR